MMTNYPDYFAALGYDRYYDPGKNKFESEQIIEKIKSIQDQWKEKYPLLDFKTPNLRFDNLVNFNFTFTNEIELLNTDPK
jgi:hypothetical protein